MPPLTVPEQSSPSQLHFSFIHSASQTSSSIRLESHRREQYPGGGGGAPRRLEVQPKVNPDSVEAWSDFHRRRSCQIRAHRVGRG